LSSRRKIAVLLESSRGVTGWDGHRAYELNVATLLSLRRREPVTLPLSSEAADAERASIVQY
jgi:hypothetical protein